MAREFKRADRYADAMQRSLSKAIQDEVRDPRLAMANVTHVTVSRDLSTAKVYVTFIGVDDETLAEQSVQILNKAAGFLRNYVAQDIESRSVPKLAFYYDKVAVYGQNLSHLIDKAVAKDKASGNHDDSSQEES